MRIVTLRAGADTVELHPRVTVLSGVSAASRIAVVDAVAGLAQGRVPLGAGGLLECSGVRFPWDADLVGALDLPDGVDAVLRPTDLPGAALPVGELRIRLEHARDGLVARRQVVAAARERLEEVQAGEALAHRRPEMVAELERRRAELARLETTIGDVRSGSADVLLGQDDVRAIEAAHDRVIEAEARVARSRIPNPAARRRLRDAERAELEVLGRFGLPSYGAYLLRTATMHIDPETARTIGELEDQRAAAEKAVAEATDELDRCDAVLAGRDRALADARLSLDESVAAERHAAEAAGELERRVRAAEDEAARRAAGAYPPGRDADETDVEVYVLARLAGVRAGGCAGALPFVIDDALAGVPADARTRLLGLLDRLSVAVQMVYLTDDETVRRWAASLGPDRAAVVDATGTDRSDA